MPPCKNGKSWPLKFSTTSLSQPTMVRHIASSLWSQLMQSMEISMFLEIFYSPTTSVYHVPTILNISSTQGTGLPTVWKSLALTTLSPQLLQWVTILNGEGITRRWVSNTTRFSNTQRHILKDFKELQETSQEFWGQWSISSPMEPRSMVPTKAMFKSTPSRTSLTTTFKGTFQASLQELEASWHLTAPSTSYPYHRVPT